MKTLILFLNICLCSTIILAQDKTILEKWHNGSLKSHLKLKVRSDGTSLNNPEDIGTVGDTLFLELGYENGFPALKRWGKDSLFTFDFEGHL